MELYLCLYLFIHFFMIRFTKAPNAPPRSPKGFKRMELIVQLNKSEVLDNIKLYVGDVLGLDNAVNVQLEEVIDMDLSKWKKIYQCFYKLGFEGYKRRRIKPRRELKPKCTKRGLRTTTLLQRVIKYIYHRSSGRGGTEGEDGKGDLEHRARQRCRGNDIRQGRSIGKLQLQYVFL